MNNIKHRFNNQLSTGGTPLGGTPLGGIPLGGTPLQSVYQSLIKA
jgi:hypothetical protein